MVRIPLAAALRRAVVAPNETAFQMAASFHGRLSSVARCDKDPAGSSCLRRTWRPNPLLHAVTVSLAFLSLAIAGQPALAQSTNASPTLILNDKPFDPTTVPIAADADKQLMDSYLNAIKTATGNSVMTVGANMVGVNYYFGSSANPSTIADAARASLELCEYGDKAPCIIISINGKDARAPDGAWPNQPEMLVKTPGSRFDPWTIPFNSQFNRAIGGFLQYAAPPVAIVVSNAGGWSSGGGTTILEAIDTAFANCAKSYPSNVCILYSVNGTVVMAQ